MSELSDALVLSELIPTATQGVHIGRITLNSPKTLNSLNLEIILSLSEILGSWEKDSRVAAIFIEGNGEKAFCAGGDVKRIHGFIETARQAKQDPSALCQVFFENEYRLDHLIHSYPKPVMIWGDGIIMGGGIGIAAGASHRIVTETTMLAMPEITIGLYPDVAASYFLPKMPGKLGLFLALTAARLNAGDALFVGLADHFVPRANKEQLIESLKGIPFKTSTAKEQVSRAITALGSEAPHSNLQKRQAEIDALFSASSVEEIAARFKDLAIPDDDKFLAAARKTMLHGSPTSLKISFEQYHRSKGLSLKEAFEQELILSIQCCLHHDFAEGVRALLIDKDNAPRWSPAELKDVSKELVDEHFHAPWPHSEDHPLHDL